MTISNHKTQEIRFARFFAFALIPSVLAGGQVAVAQDIRSWSAPHNSTLPRQVEWAQHHASTIEEGRLRGRADLEAARGEAFKNRQLGENYRQEAEYKRMQNELVRIHTRFQKREINKHYRFAAARERAEQRKTLHATNQQREVGPAVGLFDPETGTPRWPVALQDARYASQRQALDEVFQGLNPYEGGVGSLAFRRVKRETDQIRNTLRGQIRELPAKEYLAARRFLKSLVAAVEHPVAHPQVAAK